MEWLILGVQLIILAGLGALALLAKNYLPSYTKAKGKNLATREDIHEITRQIESAKIDYAKDLEGLKSQLNAKFHAHTVRFEKEFQVYEHIWKALLEIRNATLKLRPIGDSIDPNEPEAERKRKRLEIFGKAYKSFYPAVYENKPFFPLDLFKRLETLLILMDSEAFDYGRRRHDPDEPKYDPNYWETAEANAAKILEETDAICDSIRERIESL